MQFHDAITMSYKKHGPDSSIPILFDTYLPLSNKTQTVNIPVVIYFHGGGLTVGNRKSWFPTWLQKRVISLGYAFISADYRLLPPATVYDIIEDLQDLFRFIKDVEFNRDSQTFRIDIGRIGVAGSSAGGLCAYLAAIHCSPKPKALISMYGMGGDFLIPHYLKPKHEIFFRGRDLLEPTEFSEYLYPFSEGPLFPTSDSPQAYHPQTYHIPGYPANKRMLLPRLYLQLGTFLDYYTGLHVPSLSKGLLGALNHSTATVDTTAVERFLVSLPQSQSLRSVFPQLSVDETWPATILLHGTADTAVPVLESRTMRDLLIRARVPVELLEFQDCEHSFDYEPGSEERWMKEFNIVETFLRTWLHD